MEIYKIERMLTLAIIVFIVVSIKGGKTEDFWKNPILLKVNKYPAFSKIISMIRDF